MISSSRHSQSCCSSIPCSSSTVGPRNKFLYHIISGLSSSYQVEPNCCFKRFFNDIFINFYPECHGLRWFHRMCSYNISHVYFFFETTHFISDILLIFLRHFFRFLMFNVFQSVFNLFTSCYAWILFLFSQKPYLLEKGVPTKKEHYINFGDGNWSLKSKLKI